MGLLGAPPVPAILEPQTAPYLSEYDDEDDAPIPPSRLAAFRDQLFRERDDVANADARYRKLRIERGEPEFLNSDAYGPAARIMVDGVVTELAGDRKRKANQAYLGDTIENLAKGAERPAGAHSSGGGRVGTDAKVEKLKRWRRRATFDDEPRAPTTIVVSARITPQHKDVLHDHRVTTSTLLTLVARALLAGATRSDVVGPLEALARKRATALP